MTGKAQPAAVQAASSAPAHGRFPNTRWSLVVCAGGPAAEPESRAALESLCQGYWFPVYAFIRQRGHTREDAQDLTQEFFVRVLRGSFFERATPEKGRFRSFVLAAAKHYLSDAHDRDTALKRGGGIAPLPFDMDSGESAYLREPRHLETPERIFERKWALTVLDRVMANLRDEFLKNGNLERFERLQPYLTGAGAEKYAALAAELGMGEAAMKSAIFRMRARFRELLRSEVEATVADPADVDLELRFLLKSVSTRAEET